MTMNRFARAAAFLMLSFGAVEQAVAGQLDALQGAWITGGTNCADTFKKVDGTIEFKDRGSSLTTGLIIRGNKIMGPMATCSVERIREEKEYFSAYMSCVDAVMFSDMSVSFQPIDATKFKRFVSDFPEVFVTYSKCEL
ncbi:hypothetical protein MesoLjLc_39320 [Mesorhizobium sp. L-8-10]|nr:hypothetical protein MesoLjLc_39320 [Mesorhizobium sp. L-8-10]